MSRIYRSAATVLAWLGPGDHSLAYSTINLLAREMYDDTARRLNEEKLSRLDWLQEHPSLCSDDGPRQSGSGFQNLAWSAVATFVRDPYWTRVWIFQEVILARELLFISNGLAFVTWPMLPIFQRGFGLIRKNIRKLSLPRPNYLSPSVWLALATELASVSNIEQPCFARGIFRNRSNVPQNRNYSLIMSSFASRKAADPRDYIYGLLAITEIPIVPDYNKTVSDVYVEYTAIWVETCRDMRDIMMEWPKGIVGEAWQRMELHLIRLITNWRLIATTSGYLGLAPRGTAVGDRLCVLKGSDVPVLLRRTNLGSYTVVGTTFMEGLMDGEAAELEQARKGMDQWFQIQ
ncbi:hypothetical protein LCI18_005979 [Fusarium solani-melongenae]|uniref:Uncharacterized protein n=1 Tax=Fusarium solani subsp. cucurbitae TaxID=2747967 RepID=A0ACD3Z1B1_FUSSC|nr:hypothetical protein LCI18_005979 [Fusarium solani-melongenae]